MSITMHTGRPGSGKTYSMTAMLIKDLSRGAICLVNYKIFVESENLHYWKNIQGLQELINIYVPIARKRGVPLMIYMDEAHVYFNSRKWKEMPAETLRLLAQHRKDGMHIHGTVQHVNRLDVVMRELIDYWYTYTSHLLWFTRWEFDIDQDKMKKFVLSKKWIWKRKKIYKLYDTLEKITG